jgi:hypothetical protein
VGQRRIPDPPSIPPLYFGGDFDNPASHPPSEDRSATRVSFRYSPIVDYIDRCPGAAPHSIEFSATPELLPSGGSIAYSGTS